MVIETQIDIKLSWALSCFSSSDVSTHRPGRNKGKKKERLCRKQREGWEGGERSGECSVWWVTPSLLLCLSGRSCSAGSFVKWSRSIKAPFYVPEVTQATPSLMTFSRATCSSWICAATPAQLPAPADLHFSWSRLKWKPAESGVWPKSTGCRTEDQAKRVALGLKNDGQKENSCTRTGLDIAEVTRKVIQLLFLLLFLLNSLNIFTCYSEYSPSPRLTLFFSFIILIFVWSNTHQHCIFPSVLCPVFVETRSAFFIIYKIVALHSG